VGSSLDSNLTVGSDASIGGEPQSAGSGGAAAALPLPLPILAGAAGGGLLLLAGVATLLFFCCAYRRSLRRRRITHRVSLWKVAAADRLLTAKAAGGEESTAYQLDALAAVLAGGGGAVRPSRGRTQGPRSALEPSGLATREQLTAGVVGEMLRLDGGSVGLHDTAAGSDAPATLACRAARVALVRQLTAALPRSALDAAVEASVHAASNEIERQRGSPGEAAQASALRTPGAASHSLTSALVVNPLASGPQSDDSRDDTRDGTASASTVQRAIIDSAVAALLGDGASGEVRGEGAAPATAAAAPARRFVLPSQPGLFAALADAGAASTVFLRAYHTNAAAADARLPTSSCVPLAALLPADGGCLPQPGPAKYRLRDGDTGSSGRAAFGAARSLCVARMQDRMAAARRSQPDPGSAVAAAVATAGASRAGDMTASGTSEDGSSLDDDADGEEPVVTVELADFEGDEAARAFAYAQPTGAAPGASGGVVRTTTTTARGSAQSTRSSVQAVSLGTLSHKRSAGLGAMRASAGELKTAAVLTEAQLARRTVEALVVLALDACAKRAAELVVNAVTEDTPGCVATHLASVVQLEAAKHHARVVPGPVATAVGVLHSSSAEQRGPRLENTSNTMHPRLNGNARGGGGISSALYRPSLVFAQSSPLHPLSHVPSVSSAEVQASLAERLLSAELAVLQSALQSAEALARTLAWETAWAALACRRNAATGRTGKARAAAARSSLAFVDSPLLQLIKQRAGVGARTGKPSALLSGSHKQAADMKSILRLSPEQQGFSALSAHSRKRSSVVVRSTADAKRGGAASSALSGGRAPSPAVAAADTTQPGDMASAAHPRSKVRPSLLPQSPASPATPLPQRHRASRGSIGTAGRAAYSPYRRGGVGGKLVGLTSGGAARA
jgi:hypothetical protein